MRHVPSFVVLVVALASRETAAEPARKGAIIGVRRADLVGDVSVDSTPAFAGALVVDRTLTPTWSIATEPGLRRAGSDKYALLLISVPVLAVARFPIGRARLRLTSGLAPSLIAKATLTRSTDREHDGESVRGHVRRLNLELMVGLGVESTLGTRTECFLELRGARGVVNIHAHEPGLVVVSQELGLWAGVLL